MEYKLKQTPDDFVVVEIPAVKDEGAGEYLYFFLTKKNLNTLKAVKLVAEKLRIGMKRAGWAGNKDKNAITTQLISLHNVKKEEVEAASFSDIRLKYFGQGTQRVFVGNLEGNHFRITLRGIKKEDLGILKGNFARLEKAGMIPNYFDEQRFGGENLEVGKALLKRDFKSAAAKIYRREMKNPVNALRNVHNSNLSLYIHAYQSLLFNEILRQYVGTGKEVAYRYGNFIFPDKHKENIGLPIIGFGTEPDQNVAEILKEHGLSQRDFVIKQLPGLSVEGTVRQAFAAVGEFSIGPAEDDELNKGRKKVEVKFSLPKGSYATILVRQLCA